ncbi:uncharacterized protein LOC116850031 isoform X2 [Odontomachus brunneus]|uniref:uncharacterized protein LOC116850031 isoform X2 n=1 Tax=Odontomachus brunneus TaxID=486640 RepID=UPI0013F2262E|nr:uncharacterized protein LOC116850031 isoform X2 [Odontomachus brunneus]
MNSTTTCNCNETTPTTEEYHTALSEFGTSTPQEWRTSTRYEAAEPAPEFPSTPPRIMRQDYRRSLPQDTPLRITSRRRNLTVDAMPDVEDRDDEEDVGYSTTETVRQISSMTEHSYVPETNAVPGTYRLRRARRAQRPSVMRQYAPRMTTITPCGKCLRI